MAKAKKVAKTLSGCGLRADFILFGYFATLRFAQYDEKGLIRSRFALANYNRSNGGVALHGVLPLART